MNGEFRIANVRQERCIEMHPRCSWGHPLGPPGQGRIIAHALDVTLVRRALLPPMRLADRAIQTQDQLVQRSTLVDGVDPGPGEIHQCRHGQTIWEVRVYSGNCRSSICISTERRPLNSLMIGSKATRHLR